MKAKTLREIITEHPDWLDLPVGVYRSDGEIDFVGAAGTVYKSEYNDNPDIDIEERSDNYAILVFAAI